MLPFGRTNLDVLCVEIWWCADDDGIYFLIMSRSGNLPVDLLNVVFLSNIACGCLININDGDQFCTIQVFKRWQVEVSNGAASKHGKVEV
jgi:hypothetical protein